VVSVPGKTIDFWKRWRCQLTLRRNFRPVLWTTCQSRRTSTCRLRQEIQQTLSGTV